jgi:hypothetical protein
MLAVPLAARQNAGKLKPTWTRPFLARSRQEVHMTVSLPCFVDLSTDSPQLVGAVSFDVAVSGKGDGVWRTLLPTLDAFRPSTPLGVAALKEGLQVSLVLRQASGESGVVLLNALIRDFYAEGSWRPHAPLRPSLHALQSAYEPKVFADEGVLDKILGSSNGSYTTMAGVPTSVQHSMMSEWDLTWPLGPPTPLKTVSYVWQEHDTLPVTVVLSLPAQPTKRVKARSWTADALDARQPGSCQGYEEAGKVLEALHGAQALCGTPPCYTCRVKPDALPLWSAATQDSQADQVQFNTIQFQHFNVSGGGDGARQGQDVLVTPLAMMARDGWFASSPPAAPRRQACRDAAQGKASSTPSVRRVPRAHRRGAVGEMGSDSKGGKAEGECGRLQRAELGTHMYLTSAAPLLWSLADNASSSTSFRGAEWRGTRFLSIAGCCL